MIPECAKELERKICEAITEYARETGSFINTIKVKYTAAPPDRMTCISLDKEWIKSLCIDSFFSEKELQGKWVELPQNPDQFK